MIPIIAVGELLIDFVCSDTGESLETGTNFIKKAGGAPANVCAAAARLGGDARFAGSVGNDSFGGFLKNTLVSCGVDTSCLEVLQENTTLAFVSLKDQGERDFVFVRGADEHYDDVSILKGIDKGIIHFGSATALLGGKLFESYLNLLKTAGEKKLFVSFDPNFRTDLWKNNEAEFIKKVMEVLPLVHFVKFSDEEILMITGESSIEKAISGIHAAGVTYVAVTVGSKGTLFSSEGRLSSVPSIKIEPVDTTGAGDAFVGAFLYSLSCSDDPARVMADASETEKMVFFSNCAAALVCTRYGAIESMPDLPEVEKAVKNS